MTGERAERKGEEFQFQQRKQRREREEEIPGSTEGVEPQPAAQLLHQCLNPGLCYLGLNIRTLDVTGGASGGSDRDVGPPFQPKSAGRQPQHHPGQFPAGPQTVSDHEVERDITGLSQFEFPTEQNICIKFRG